MGCLKRWWRRDDDSCDSLVRGYIQYVNLSTVCDGWVSAWRLVTRKPMAEEVIEGSFLTLVVLEPGLEAGE